MEPELRGRLSAGQVVLDGDLRDLQIVNGPGGPMLYAVTGQNGGLSAFDLTEGGLASAMPDPVFFSPNDVGIKTGNLTVVQTDDGPRLMLSSGPGGRLTGYDLEHDGGLGDQVRLDLPAGPGAMDGLASAQLADGGTVHYVLDAGGGQLRAYAEDAAGDLSPVPGMAPIPLATQKAGQVLNVVVDGAHHVLVAGSDWSGPGTVASYRVDPATGALEARDSTGAVDGLGINTPAAMASATADGVAWVVMADAASQSLSVLRLGPDGSLMPTDYLIDTQDTRFGNVQALAMLETDGHVFVAAGGGDDGFTLFSLLPNGRLIHAATLAHAPGRGLEDVTALELVRVGDELQIFAAGEGAGGLSQFTVPLDDLGQVIRDIDPAGQALTGTAGDDVLLATATGARDRLEGGAGDDTLVSAGEGTDLQGGAGGDRFVISGGEAQHHILDFEPGQDRLDLSGLPFLRSAAQLQYEALADGALLRYGDTEIRVTSATGGPLTLGDLLPGDSFEDADHFPVGGQTPGRPVILIATDEDDRIEGTSANEEITGGEGADIFVLTPNMGADTITDFDPDRDRLDFSALDAVELAALTSVQLETGRLITLGDSSTLLITGLAANSAPIGTVEMSGWAATGFYLTAGADTLQDADGLGVFRYQWLRDGQEIEGATGLDYRLTSKDVGAQVSIRVTYLDELGTHEAVVSSATKSVAISRHATHANDLVQGSRGRDFIVLYKGADTVFGYEGDDTLLGGNGADFIKGGDGQDILTGDDDHDELQGGAGNDTLLGGSGNDTLSGQFGHDDLSGGEGSDTLWGGMGNDIQRGENGDDVLRGWFGNDTLFGGAGNDVLAGEGDQDVLWGGDGADTLSGGDGADALSGEQGADFLQGGNGDDTLSGGDQDDILSGQFGHDDLSGGEGSDTLWGGMGNDIQRGENGDDVLRGWFGNDTLFGGDGNDVLAGEGDQDVLWGGDGADTLSGGDGADALSGEQGADFLQGGSGDDTLSGGGEDDILSGQFGHDDLSGGEGADTLWGGMGND
ncbi:MAG: hypothetical protein AB3N22_06905, partial [Ruegeria sp.]